MTISILALRGDGEVEDLSVGLERARAKRERLAARIEVEFHADAAFSDRALDAELVRIVSASSLWDGTPPELQVVSSQADGRQLRARVRAIDAASSDELEALVRAELSAFLEGAAVPAEGPQEP